MIDSTLEIINPKWASRARPGIDATEHQEARTFFADAKGRHYGDWLAHVQNEQNNGKRGTIGAKSAEGVRAGFPDYVLELARWGWHGLRIELKRKRGSVVSDDQLAWQRRLLAEGYLSVFAPGNEVAIAWCNWYAMPQRRSTCFGRYYWLPRSLSRSDPASNPYYEFDPTKDATIDLAPPLIR